LAKRVKAKTVKNEDLLQWALTGAKERLSALTAEIERIYRTFPSLRSAHLGSPRKARSTATDTAAPRKRRRFSAAARAKLRASAKRRWAEAKKAGKKRLG
jgi:hypothetical protein